MANDVRRSLNKQSKDIYSFSQSIFSHPILCLCAQSSKYLSPSCGHKGRVFVIYSHFVLLLIAVKCTYNIF